LSPAMVPAISALIGAATNGAIKSSEELEGELNKALALDDAEASLKLARWEIKKLKAEVQAKAKVPAVMPGNGVTPTGKLRQMEAKEVFPKLEGKVGKIEWDAPHAGVPEVDADYQFGRQVRPFLWGLENDRPMWLVGDTGTGKTTFVEQVAARLGRPTFRINCDSEITRLDLIGRDTLTTATDDKGNQVTVSKFVDGILPQAMVTPGVLIVDEIDFIRPDVAYALQRALEGNGLLITEDGGRLVQPHPLFRIVATANTRGQGNSAGHYQGARTQSAAFLDRFRVWIEFDYLNAEQEVALLKAKVPELPDCEAAEYVAFANEVRMARKNGEIAQAMSPRTLVNFAQMAQGVGPEDALAAAVLVRCEPEDAVVIQGLAQRCLKS